ncbi:MULTISPECIES: hypothetical protein [Enterobacteriaceae]|uniref:hypothetical protein n=1 Tax=Enterobacteriaceae TaxID=543 RepID=UPI0009440570|nr:MULTISPECIES: hypothetical protein [Enterobacteriaceae]EDP0617335.1 hypothetical protein [Salmonella enterica]MDD0503485.1 hypothetical protein [Shigella sonnei]HCD6221832.1 hypothetical protein [Enterobacter hormaechei]HCM9370305.1 hypothetical protein [Enterobacter hormaechei subsp. xiangfangensis]HDC4293636.1 hypothetical protein [Enterobacter cloacae]
MATVKRLQIDISEQSFERLKRLKENSDASSYAEVTNKAYRVYEFFIDALQQGNEIKLVDKDGNEKIVEFL